MSSPSDPKAQRDRYRRVFSESKSVLRNWEADFIKAEGKKPTADDYTNKGTDMVKRCYKNCKKIKAFFKVDEEKRRKSKDHQEEEDSRLNFSGLFPSTAATPEESNKSPTPSTRSRSSSGPCADISNIKKPASAWGAHVNIAAEKANSGKKTELVRAATMSSTFDLGSKLDVASTSSGTRSSLKKRGSVKRKPLLQRSVSTFDTLGLEDNSQQDKSNKPEEHAFIDPLSRFDPEISMDSSDVVLGAGADIEDLSQDSMFASLSTGKKPALSFKNLAEKIGESPLVSGGSKPFSVNAISRGSPALPARKLDKGWLARVAGGGEQNMEEAELSITPKPPQIATEENSQERKKRLREENAPAEQEDSSDSKRMRTQRSESPDIFGSPETVVTKPPLLEEAPEPRTSTSANAEYDFDNKDDDFMDVSDNEEEEKKKPAARRRKPANPKKHVAAPKKKAVRKTKAAKAEEEKEAAARSARATEPSKVDVYSLGFEEPEAEEEALKKQRARARYGSSKILTKGQILAGKVNSGKANENYVKINLKKKTFVRGRKTMTGGKYRRQEFKRKTNAKEGISEKVLKCFKCGGEGHWANDCIGAAGGKLMPQRENEEGEVDDGDFPSLEEAAQMARGGGDGSNLLKKKGTTVQLFSKLQEEKGVEAKEGVDPGDEDIFDDADNDMLLQACSNWTPEEAVETEQPDLLKKLPPYFSDDQSDEECKLILKEALLKFGYDDFRGGQEEAIMRILRGDSTLVLLATGSGKSLIYQLPAYLYAERDNCITIVVSPLVSLMEDQVTGLPPLLRAGCLHSNQTPTVKERIIEEVKSGSLHFLLVSPESLASGSGVFSTLIKDLPPIAFICVDEAHCVSQWSHNFRPAYLRLSKIITDRLGVGTVLGLTATAPNPTIEDIATHLRVCPKSGVIRGPLLPKNLVLSVSKDDNKDTALLKLLSGERLNECDSVIIYCTRRDECMRLSALIRTHLQDNDMDNEGRLKGRKKMSFTAEPYHAGLTPARRRTVQNCFMSGKLRIVVATVAFGMGIDKSDIRSVIHYNMPKTFESYIQEIGRAGRDGLEAHCHLFLSNDGTDLNELKRHIFSNSVDGHTIRKLLSIVFDSAMEASSETVANSKYREVAVSIEKTVELLDLAEENISTLLCYLENDPKEWIKIHNPVYAMCKVRCYNGPRQLKTLARMSPPLAAAIAIMRKRGDAVDKTAIVEFPVVDVSAAMGWDSGTVKRELKNLQWMQKNCRWVKSGALVEMSDLAFHFEALRGLGEEEKDDLKNFLTDRCVNQERSELHSLQRIFRSFSAVAHGSVKECADEADIPRSDKLKAFVSDYFLEDEKPAPQLPLSAEQPLENEAQLKSAVRIFVCQHSDHTWSGRAVARVFHGISSPNFPAKQWGRVRRYWRAYLDVDFNTLCKLATREVVAMRTSN